MCLRKLNKGFIGAFPPFTPFEQARVNYNVEIKGGLPPLEFELLEVADSAHALEYFRSGPHPTCWEVHHFWSTHNCQPCLSREV